MSTVRIQVRRGLHDDWLSVDPVLAPGEMGLETDTHLYKFGNEAGDVWSDLTYANENPEGIQNLLASYVELVDRGAANGVAALDSNKDLIVPSSSIILEGATDNTYETTLFVNDPTADRTITFKDQSGTVALVSDLDSYAALSGATFTGNIQVPTSIIFEGATDNAYETTFTVTDPTADRTVTLPNATGTIALTSDITTAINNLVDGAPLALDTLNELAAAINDDASYASTITTALGNKLPLAGGTMSGAIAMGTNKVTGLGAPTSDNDASTKKYVDDSLVPYIPNVAAGITIAQLASGTVPKAQLPTDVVYNSNLASERAAIEQTAAADATSQISTHSSDTTNIHGITDTAALATKTGTETFTNKTLTSPVINTPTGITKSDVGLANVDNTTDANKPISTATQTALDLKLASSTAATTYAPIASPTFTGTVSGITKSHVGLGNVDNTSDASKPVSTATQTALDLKAPLASPTFTGTVTLPSGTVTSAMILDGTIANADISSSAAIALSKLATDPLARANHTGSQAASTISDFTEAAQDAVGGMLGTGLTYNDTANTITVDTTNIQLRVTGVSDTEIGYLDGVTSAIQTQMDAKAPLASPTFTGTVSGITKNMVGLGSVDNTADTAKPVSTATQTALDAKLASATAASTYAPLASPTFTGTVTLPGAPTSDLHAATKLYVDNVTAGINFHEAVHAASVSSLSANYANGTSGVGATLTADTNRAFATVDGESVALGQRVLIKDQTDAKQNGIYTLTTVGSVSAPWVLTRATDADNNPVGELKNGDFCLVINGTVNASYGFINNSATNPIVIGTDNITYTQFNAGKTVAAGNGLQEATPGTLSIDTTITQTRVSGVSDTEIGYLDGVTSGIQGQLDAKAPLASPTFTGTVTLPTGTVTSGMILDGTIVNGDINASAAIDWTKLAISSTVSATELGYVDGVTSAIQTQIDAKAPTNNASFTGTFSAPSGTVTSTMIANDTIVNADINSAAAIDWTKLAISSTVSATELGYVDGVTSAIQTQIDAKTPELYTLVTDATTSRTLSLSDKFASLKFTSGSATTVTVPANSAVAFPVGSYIEMYQYGAGQITVTQSAGVTVNATDAQKKSRVQYSSLTLIKVATDEWLLVGDTAA